MMTILINLNSRLNIKDYNSIYFRKDRSHHINSIVDSRLNKN
jgi:hypothetical protein